MPEHANVPRIRDAYTALATFDVDAALRDLAPDGTFHFKGQGPLSGDHVGRDAITTALLGLAQVTGGSLTIEVSGVFADDHHAVVVLRETGSRPDGATLDVQEVHVLALDDQGRITDMWDLPQDPGAHERFFDGD